ncbi:hypothetical protein ACIHAR_08200 [Streptomyces sp. NPDC052016]|uniref:hypothetical protein n=1 Tax=Streptomyces sp. NPDC052016 TaxID=3365680 RepID=UPI0037D52D85
MAPAPPGSLATSEEIHGFLAAQVNLLLRRVGMYGGVPALWPAFEHLSFVEHGTEAWRAQGKEWLDRARRSTGVHGVFRDMSPGRRVQDHDEASVYAEFARRRGRLVPDRVMAADAYVSLREGVRAWAEEDRTWPDVVEEFGEPSVLLGGASPYFGKTLGCFRAGSGRTGGVVPPLERRRRGGAGRAEARAAAAARRPLR